MAPENLPESNGGGSIGKAVIHQSPAFVPPIPAPAQSGAEEVKGTITAAQKKKAAHEKKVFEAFYKIICVIETMFQHGRFKDVRSDEPVTQEHFDLVKNYIAAQH